MSFTFNSAIPATNDNPSVDQPGMQTNNISTAGIIAVDHVGFNTSGGGQHLQVTFNSNNVPSVPTSPPVLFTNTVAGLPQLFFYSGSATAGSTQYQIGATGGSVLLLGGMILKWGTVTACPDNTNVNFSTNSGSAFPNNCFAFYPSVISSSTSNPINVTVNTFSASTFKLRIFFQSGGTTTGNIYYLAIGN